MKRVLIVLSLTAITAIGWHFFGDGSVADVEEVAAREITAVPVEVLTLKEQLVAIDEELPGRTVAAEVAEIRPQVTGIITERLFVEGSAVEAGEQLYQIDPAPYEAAYRRAEADLQKARANLASVEAKAKRYEELVKIDAISKQEYDDVAASLAQAKADIAIAQAAVATSKINLDYTKVYAPISGRIGKSLVTKGALVTANQSEQLTRVTRLDPIYVDVVQPVSKLMEMRRHLNSQARLSVELIFEGQQEAYPHKGELQFADVTVDSTTDSVQLRALFPNPDNLLLPGMFVRTRVVLSEVSGFLVPQRATMRDPAGNLTVWTVDAENSVSLRTITAVRAVGDAWLVQAGISEGEQVVVKGIQKLAPGARVDPLPSMTAAGERREEYRG